jgi:hypothetical protein
VVPDLTVGSPWGGGEVGNHADGGPPSFPQVATAQLQSRAEQ